MRSPARVTRRARAAIQAVKSVSAERAGLQANADAHREALRSMASRIPELEIEKKAVVRRAPAAAAWWCMRDGVARARGGAGRGAQVQGRYAHLEGAR